MSLLQWIQRHRWGAVLGGLVTAASVSLLASGAWKAFDQVGLDFHFRFFNQLEDDPRLVLIDIDDRSLAAVDAYPWPRKRYAQLIDTLHELGAAAIVLDLVFPEPTKPRTEHAALGKYYDVETGAAVRGDPREDPIIFDDDELARAVQGAGNVYLGFTFGELGSPDSKRMEHSQLGLSPHDAKEPQSVTRLATLVLEDFRANAKELSRRSDGPEAILPDQVERHLPAAKRLAARWALSRFRSQFPQGDWPSFLRFVLPHEPLDLISSDHEVLLSTYLAEVAWRAVAEKAPVCATSICSRLAVGIDPHAPIAKVARAAKGVGFVSYERESSGAIVREIPLLAQHEGQLFGQLGFLVAADCLGLEPSSFQVEHGAIVLGANAGARRLSMDENGATLLHWHAPAMPGRWETSFIHIPAARLMEIPIHREGIAENRKRWNLALAELMDLRHADTPSEAVRYESLIRERRALEDSMGRPAGALSGQDAQRKIADLTAAISAMEDDARTWLQRLASLWQDVRPTTDEERIEQERVRRLQQDILEGRLADRLHRADATIQSRIDELIGELRSTVASKICLIGYTASAVADLVATPVSNAMPGVMVHANVLNSMLQNRPAFRAPLGIQILLISACGLLTTLMTCAQRPWWSLLGMLLILAGAVAGSALTFQYFTLHLPSPAAAVTTITCWAVVTLYRQFIAERGHRRFQRALAQYTSSAIAQRIAESRGAESFTPHPAIVTCFFIDLAGFTRLSEQLGPDRTRRILNPFLSMVSRVLIDHDALVNKFMGDGVFAFFNAPLWPCAHHAKAACESALVIQRELDELNRSRRLADADAPLAARIGLATGEVFVGDYGSESKLDYTCIGDTVNLASRLEKINRYLGTRILIDEATCRAAGDRFAVRRLGRFLIAGKSRPVELIELAGLADTEDAQSQSYRRQFEVALADFQCCRADRGRRLFEECLRQSPDDRVVRRYLAAINAHPHASTAETSLTVLPLADFPSEEEETADGRFKSSPD